MLKLRTKMYSWLVIGISGVTCGGKTSLTFRVRDLLNQYFFSRKQPVNVLTISQDDFFLKPDDPRHVFLPSLGHNNWELPTAVDLNKMYQKALEMISGEDTEEVEVKSEGEMEAVSESSKMKLGLKGILLIEGFLALNHEPTRTLCHLGYYIVLSRATCEKRRSCRSYDPPDIPGYFEQIVWPEHVYRRAEVIGKGILVDRSDLLSMNEVHRALDEEKILKENVMAISEGSKNDLPTQGNQSVQLFQDLDFTRNVDECNSGGKILIGDDVKSNEKDNLWMRRGGDVVLLEGDFGECGLGVVNGVRVLNGGVVNKEDMAKMVFQDILREIKLFE